jgi:hypothetical protein
VIVKTRCSLSSQRSLAALAFATALRFIAPTHQRQQLPEPLASFDAFLLAAVAMTQRHRIEQFGAFFAAGFEVDGDAEGRAGFVRTGVAAYLCMPRL